MNKNDVSIYHPASINHRFTTITNGSIGNVTLPLTRLYIVIIISLIIMYFYFISLSDNNKLQPVWKYNSIIVNKLD